MGKVTRELQEVFKKNKGLKKVYFDEFGNYFFQKFEIEVHEVDESGYSTGVLKVDSLPGAKKTAVKIWVDRKKGKTIDKLVNTHYTPVDHEMTRDEVLNAKAVMNSMSDEEKVKALTIASEIMADRSNLNLLRSLNLQA